MEVVKVMKDGLLDVEATGVKGVEKWMPISAWFGKERTCEKWGNYNRGLHQLQQKLSFVS